MVLHSATAIAPIGDAAVRRVGASLLAARVIAARSEQGLSQSALQAATRLSRRTLRSIEEGDPDRRYAPQTLARLDEPLGWPTMTAWAIWRGEEDELDDDVRIGIAAKVDALQRTVEEMMDNPPALVRINRIARLLSREEREWVVELAAAAASLTLSDRARVLEMVKALHG